MTSKLDYLLELSKNSFNSLGYNDWSSSYKSKSNATFAPERTLNRNGKNLKK